MMATVLSEDVHAQAIDWHIRLRHGDGAVWEAFTLWLEVDAAHAAAYDVVEAADDAVLPQLPPVRAPRVVQPAIRPRRWAVWGGAALAASIAAGFVFAPQLASQRYDIATRPGEQRVVSLDATTQIVMNGLTRLTLDRRDARFASLAAGEALFLVRHDAAAPFRVEVGDNRIVDVGTVFNVVRQGGEVRIAVAEGSVIYNPDGEAVAVLAGQSLIDPAGTPRIVLANTDARQVGGWRQGRLSYAAEPMTRVAADLARALGLKIDVAPQLGERRFSGTLVLDRSGSAQLARISRVLQVDLRRADKGWTMVPVDGGVR